MSELLRREPLARTRLYGHCRAASALAWSDGAALLRHPLTRRIADQLYRALGSIAANVVEGYSRSAPADRARLFEYALGSARESREWYIRSIPVLGHDRAARRIGRLNEIIAILTAMLRRSHAHRGRAIRFVD